ncbi:hypothetical protein [Streptomyces sp. NPDC020298]|uniref:hypothetical protein n=1 Tax=unclassified Streptomyces TaxID=2593676 RepID=UPI0033ECCCA8
MSRGTVPTSGARVVGAIICAALALIELVWVIRDIQDVGLHDTVWTWSGAMLPGQHHPLLATAASDVVLLVVYIVVCLTSGKPAGGAALVTAAALTLAYRTPTVWIYSADWTKGAPHRTWLLLTGIAGVVGAIAMIITVIAGRAAVSDTSPGVPPAPPRTGPAVFAGVLLAILGLVSAAWQVYDIRTFSSDTYGTRSYENLFTGKYSIGALLGTPPGWNGWVTAVLCLLTAVQAFVRTPLARTMGMALGWALAVFGAVVLTLYKTLGLFTFDDRSTSETLELLTVLLETAVGVLTFLLLMLPDRGRTAAGVPGGQAPAQEYGDWGPPAAPKDR